MGLGVCRVLGTSACWKEQFLCDPQERGPFFVFAGESEAMETPLRSHSKQLAPFLAAQPSTEKHDEWCSTGSGNLAIIMLPALSLLPDAGGRTGCVDGKSRVSG